MAQSPIAIGAAVMYTSLRSGKSMMMEAAAYDAGFDSYDLHGVGSGEGAKKRGASATQVSHAIATETAAHGSREDGGRHGWGVALSRVVLLLLPGNMG